MAGTSTSSTVSQGSAAGANLQGNTLTGHQARIQAAAAAASLYEKSFVYPSANSPAWYTFVVALLCWLFTANKLVYTLSFTICVGL